MGFIDAVTLLEDPNSVRRAHPKEVLVNTSLSLLPNVNGTVQVRADDPPRAQEPRHGPKLRPADSGLRPLAGFPGRAHALDCGRDLGRRWGPAEPWESSAGGAGPLTAP